MIVTNWNAFDGEFNRIERGGGGGGGRFVEHFEYPVGAIGPNLIWV